MEENDVYDRNTYVHRRGDCKDGRECGEDECQYHADFQQKPAGIQL